MDRIEPGHGWNDAALGMGGRAVSAMLEGAGEWPNDLFKGYPGLVCLAADLSCRARDRIGFPLVEGLGPPLSCEDALRGAHGQAVRQRRPRRR
jgi:hypothetical protein